ncbi:carbohydrate kinase family protein [Hoeflea prorocentri]|uniref:Sugar kinase n=1 Tax=Hoeflea prorocentri TaxID=1922333 RepID=A0A9X3ZHP2_9HYPH|nr:sugar kinase [Hoeflea prorocentri]MCY6381554.1 sugar kinase [Hoeflea prorocentri]MDA5399354.1 sugar kinase [Hoeflea prorocentri]
MPKFDLSAIGFLVLDTLCAHADAMPPKGGATFVEQMTMTVAGTAGATALDCAMLGLNVQIAAEVGHDPMGDWLVSEMASKGMNVDLVSRSSGAQTAMSMLPISSDGARSAFFVPGASNTFTLSEPAMEQALDADIIHLGGTGLLASFDGEPSRKLLERAKSLGRTTVFDLILANEETIGLVEPLLEHIDYFVPSIEEASAMAGKSEPAAVAEWFRAKGVKNVVLTLEGDGVFVLPHDAEAFQLPAHQVEVVDTTGCGDSFTAGLITGVSKGWSLRDSARFANTVAAHVACGLGSQGILKDFDTTKKAMNDWPLKELKQ